jgi:hypothetical protein
LKSREEGTGELVVSWRKRLANVGRGEKNFEIGKRKLPNPKS